MHTSAWLPGGERGRGRRLALGGALAGVGLMLWILSLAAGSAETAWRALLVAFAFFVPLAAGLAIWPAIVTAAHGRWLGPLEPLALPAAGFAGPSLAVLGLLALGRVHWAPWIGEELPQGRWLTPVFLFGRDLAALLVFWLAALWFARRRGPAAGPAVAAILAYCLTFSLLGFDLIMALEPHWYSSLFGAYFFITGLQAALAAWALLAVLAPATDPGRRQDLAKLLLAFSMLSTYLLFSQLLPIWYENLPHETLFVLPRLQLAPWPALSAALLALVFLGPLVMLLGARAKRSRPALGVIAAVVLAGLWLERWWLIAPQIGPRPYPCLADLAAAALLAGMLGLSMEITPRPEAGP